VRPRHCDAQGMVHAARYYTFFEEAFLRWLEAAGPGYAALRAEGVDLVIGRSGCTHHAPAGLDELLSITVAVTGRSRSTISLEFAVVVGPRAVATGEVTYVAVRGGRACPLPDALG
jgi:acyl-CoA thioester hydrolase